MDVWQAFGRWLFITGLLLVIIGGVMLFIGKIPGFGRLPGDIYYHRGNFSFFFPLATCILISILISILLNLFIRR
jgi:hypothetical protein